MARLLAGVLEVIKHTQLYRHEADKGQYGDCHRTAIACLLNIPVEDSPHFIGEYERRKAADADDDSYNWQQHQEEWLNSLGYTTVDVAYNGDCELSDLFHFMQARNPHALYLLGGTSPRGTNHTVIACGGGFFHDPHPDGGFLVGPMDNGMWEVTFILPLIMKEKQ
jgi:hypothetical protein